MCFRALLTCALVAACTPDEPAPCCADAVETGDTGPVGPGLPVEVVASDPIACVDPAARDEAPYDRIATRAELPKAATFTGAGVIGGDFDQDGYLDLILPGFWQTFYYRGGPDGPVDHTPLLDGIVLGSASGGAAADYDGDGDLDVLITRYLRQDRLLRNDGGAFVDVSEQAGLSTDARRSMVASFGDLDADGDLDLFVGAYGHIDDSGIPHSAFLPADPSFLYLNRGDGTFEDHSSVLPEAVHNGYTLAGGFFDFDGDLQPELYVVNDFGQAWRNRLLWNRGGVLEADLTVSGLDAVDTFMGLGFGDVNGDGAPDVLMPAWDGLQLLLSSEGPWADWSAARGVHNDLDLSQKVAWGTELVDLDNDGDLDAPVAFGHLESEYPSAHDQPDALFIQEPDGRFRDRAAAWGVDDRGVSRGVLALDLNGDGWLDLAKRDLWGPTLVYQSRCGAESWLRVRLHAPAPNTFAVGARVELVAGDATQVRWVHAGGTSHASGGPPEVHFGLADTERVDRLDVFWPDGEVSRLFDVDARVVLDITR